MQKIIHIFECLIFDFDGVILDSVPSKTKAFMQWIPDEYRDYERLFFDYHIKSYGVGRRGQIKHFYEQIIGQKKASSFIDEEVARFAKLNEELTFKAPIIEDTLDFIENLYESEIPMYVVSGTPHAELGYLIKSKELSHYFRSWFGTPQAKKDAIEQIVTENSYSKKHTYYVGDSPVDARASADSSVQFIYRPSQAAFNYESPVWACNDLRNIHFTTLNTKS